jgi:signal transduction histidine kinase
MAKTQYMKPYARLLTMLGQQLVKDDNVALFEIVKNSYDADATDVQVQFKNFDVKGKTLLEYEYTQKPDSLIIIKDDGIGMTEDVITNHWLNPATPIKKNLKDLGKQSTGFERVIQGEKGIGRFALFKLGKKITVITRPKNSANEYIVMYDFSNFSEDFKDKSGNYMFLDELPVSFDSRPAQTISDHGTEIIIEDLNSTWTTGNIYDLLKSSYRLKPIFEHIAEKSAVNNAIKSGFDIRFFVNDDVLKKEDEPDFIDKLKDLINNRAVMNIKGSFDPQKGQFDFALNEKTCVLSLSDANLKGLVAYKKSQKDDGVNFDKLDCGKFEFGFYIFDLTANDTAKYKLDRDDKNFIKENRIYLYRDGIRVYPYGNYDDDWLGIDIYRGTVSAGGLLSNDQITGYILISQKENPDLKDATNREGLLQNQASRDLRALAKLFLSYIRQYDYARYIEGKKKREREEFFKKAPVENILEDLKQSVSGNAQAEREVEKLVKTYSLEKQRYTQRLEITEDLAGIGLSVETASHDIMMMMSKSLNILNNLMLEAEASPDRKISEFSNDLSAVRGSFGFVKDKLTNMQSMFASSKQRPKNIRVQDVFDKIQQIFNRTLSEDKISIELKTKGKSPLVIKTTDAILMQVFINLLDNAIYWLNADGKKDKKITVLFNSDENTVVFSDNGPGILQEDIPYIFEPFYSGKGQDGRGLGLYIARQLLARNDFSIELAESKSEKLLNGANFVMDFNKKSEDV